MGEHHVQSEYVRWSLDRFVGITAHSRTLPGVLLKAPPLDTGRVFLHGRRVSLVAPNRFWSERLCEQEEEGEKTSNDKKRHRENDKMRELGSRKKSSR